MYLKNNSDFQCGLRTKKEVLTIKPGEAVHVFDSDIITLNSKLIQITESEFEKLNKKKEEKKSEVKKEEVKKEEVKKEDKDDKVKNEIKEEKDQIEAKNEDVNTNPESSDELTILETELAKLMEEWQQAEKASKKAKLQNKIKALQEEIAKLKG